MEETGKKVPVKSDKNAKPSMLERAKVFFKGVKAEFKKIIWPSREKLGKQTTAVVVISVLLGGFIRVYDLVCQYLITFIK